ncbi:glycerol-3-phosphate responsive antiterminator [Vibrio algarum]|uniref:Glycerol-3-phosphate responsive antiterminator n=1 Tax=Vibrio algarum TaxID=3020714 RepID=A0ABT4YV13_9VIBR|nr:glycerol-3-phosphate responsive antiterminator [Vibrio sp. KJ40-1]MDB1125222.1 glycerol-3-phosphate responsive antiterminator [Vibrio sp. KJ40-1]
MTIRRLLNSNRVIASVKDTASLDKALESDCKIIFILYGNICNIGQIVNRVRGAGKMAFIHIDLLEGASNQEVVVDFLKIVTQADGVISTKSQMLKAAKEHGFYTILRLFIVDSKSFHNIPKQISNCRPDSIEIMPGVMPAVTQWLLPKINIPLISSGLICDQNTATMALSAGALAISTTNEDVWKLYNHFN